MKQCGCGQVYSIAQFLTLGLPSNGVGETRDTDYDGTPLLQIWRHCTCGSTLMLEVAYIHDAAKFAVLVELVELRKEILDSGATTQNQVLALIEERARRRMQDAN